jgi:hypothetical protein
VLALSAPVAAAETYPAGGVSIESAAAVLTVITEDRVDVDVVISGGERLPVPTVRVRGDEIVIDGGLRSRLRGCTSMLGQTQVRIGGLGAVPREDLPRITVRAPRALNLEVGGAVFTEVSESAGGHVTLNGCGDTRIGAAAGDLDLTLNGSGDVDAARVGGALTATLNGSGAVNIARADADAALRLNGSGDLEVGAVAGALEAGLNGSGGVTVASVGRGARFSLNGSGDMEGGAVAGSLEADLRGSGSIEIASVDGESVALSLSSSGDIEVRGGRVGRLSARNSGSGNLRFDGAAQSSQINLSGSGNVTVADPGRVEQLIDTGSGSARLGR